MRENKKTSLTKQSQKQETKRERFLNTCPGGGFKTHRCRGRPQTEASETRPRTPGRERPLKHISTVRSRK